MLQDQSTLELRQAQFVNTICETGVVYALECEEGLATSSSNELEYENGDPVDIICFWSEETLANACIQSGWSHYKVIEISLSEFIEDWCVGMTNDGLIIGTDFDSNMVGCEADPLELMLQLISHLKEAKKTITFEKYKSLNELEKEVRDVMEGE